MNDSVAAGLSTFVGRVRRWPSVLWRWEAVLRGFVVHDPVEFLGRPIMVRHPGSTIILGAGCCIASSLRCNPLGNAQPCVIRTLTPDARLAIGPRVGMSSTIICAARSISIGEGTIFGAGAMIIDTDFHAPEGEWGWSGPEAAPARPISIGRGAFIGARAIVLKGVTIGDRAVIGAGAVVSKDVPAGGMAVGNPARLVRQSESGSEPNP